MGELALVVDPAGGRGIVLTQSECRAVALRDARSAQVLVAGFPGPRGLQGIPGSAGAAISTLPVGAIVQGLQLVRSVDGVVFPIDTTDDTHAAAVIGLALQSVTSIGSNVNVQRAGTVSDASWSWTPGVVWSSQNGALTQNPSTTGWLLQAGRVIDAQTIDIDLEPPIYRG